MELMEGWSYVVSRLQSFGKPCGTVEDGGVWMKSESGRLTRTEL